MFGIKSERKPFKPIVFFPPFVLLLAIVLFSFINYDGFTKVMTTAQDWAFKSMGPIYSFTTLVMVILCVVVCVSPLGKVKIGGSKAVPILTPFKWWAVTLCTGIAIGILFWGTAEPILHYAAPPESLGIAPSSKDAIIFAMSTVLLHWTIGPYAIYTVPTVMFAFAYYNMRKPYSFGSTLVPLFGDRVNGVWGQVIDAFVAFSLISGMATSLGQGIMSVSSGLETLFGITANPFVWLLVDAVIVGTFIASAITGITNGIKWLCDANAKLFIGMAIFAFVFGPIGYSLGIGMDGLGNYLTHFFERTLIQGTAAGDPWPQWWTIFYWAIYFAWAPITAVFLGQISVGYSIRSCVLCNLVTPAFFAGLWMIIYGGGTLHMEVVEHLGFAKIVLEQGPQAAAYFFFQHYPLAFLMIPIFTFAMYLSFVTGSDAMCTAIGGLCSGGISPESPEPPIWLKVIWGLLLGAVAWVMISFSGINGAKSASNVGGVPALIVCIGTTISLFMVCANPKKYDVHKEDYDAVGNYIGIPQTDSASETLNKTSVGQVV
ncbi:BCCT family transporter [Candidatus Formimonas warabiya]|uniref:BCCT transporter n=1 Tax=Formimonas warabiya TaxID=1761012 RepID=A0A3G1KZP6_FORW1|nr:BCCT family transporter [Candidatus Formimonas warabiya]ATW28002.1 hypothetical protein DCMF_27515 [Candidatus Formimonas warabiya]